jgi:hypothetical protein
MPFEELTAQITRQHQLCRYKLSAEGGARVHNLSASTGTSFTIYNYAAYGSRDTTGGRPATNQSPRDRIRLDFPNRYLHIQFTEPVHFAKVRPLTHVLNPVLHTTSDWLTYHKVIQVTGSAMWLLFDVEKAVDPPRVLRELYEVFRCPLSQPLINRLPADDPSYRNHINANFDILQLPEQPEPPRERPRRRATAAPSSPPPPSSTPPETQWRAEFEPVTSVASNPEAFLEFMQQQKLAEIPNLLAVTTKELASNNQTLITAWERVHFLEDKKVELETKLWAYQAAIERSNQQILADEELLALKEIINTCYEAVWLEDNRLNALTKDIIMTQGEELKAKVGKFLVTVTPDKIEYRRADGRVAKGGRLGSSYCHAPHHSATNICWGTYGFQVRTLRESRDYGQVLLMVYHHLLSVTPDDAYMYLRDYCHKLEIPPEDICDYVLGQTDFPSPLPAPLSPVEDTPTIVEVPLPDVLPAEYSGPISSFTAPTTPEGWNQWDQQVVTIREALRTTTSTTINQTTSATPSGIREVDISFTPEEMRVLGIRPQDLIPPDPETELAQTEI